MAKASRLGRLYSGMLLLAARLASRFTWCRRLLRRLESRTMPFDGHAELYARYNPSYAIVTSLGFDADTLVMDETPTTRPLTPCLPAHRRKVKTRPTRTTRRMHSEPNFLFPFPDQART